MIQYSLKCDQDHRFDSWFQSADAFDKLAASGLVVCQECGSTRVTKAIMAPNVQAARKRATPPTPKTPSTSVTTTTQTEPAPQNVASPSPEVEHAIKALKEHIEKNSNYVGENFAREARAMHLGDKPERLIHGEANLEDAKSLLDDGIAVAPLPFASMRKVN